MCEEKWGAVAAACDDGDPEGERPQTAKDAAKLWKAWFRVNSLEAARMRHCCGCVWLKQCGNYLSCSCIFGTGESRKCKTGPSCTKKQTPPGWSYPKGYDEWCAEMDRKYGTDNRKHPRNRTSFPLIYARELYEANYPTREITEITGLSVGVLQYHARTENWNKRNGKKYKATGRDLTGEKEAYRRRKEEYERKQDDNDE